jgi:pentatricopeptide repeat protein
MTKDSGCAVRERGEGGVQEAMSAWIQVLLMNGVLEKAQRVYERMQAFGMRPNLTAYTMLINEYGKAYRLGDAVRMVRDLVQGGLAPDQHTYCAILNACQHSSEGQLAFQVYRS